MIPFPYPKLVSGYDRVLVDHGRCQVGDLLRLELESRVTLVPIVVVNMSGSNLRASFSVEALLVHIRLGESDASQSSSVPTKFLRVGR